MDDTITRPSPIYLPQELINLIASKLHRLDDLSRLSLVSRTFYSEAIPYLYTHIDFASAAQGPRSEWIKKLILWSRTVTSNKNLAHRVETLGLRLPECDLPALFRRTLNALQTCVNLRELELYHASYQTPVSWLFPAVPHFALLKLTTDIPASAQLARVLESQPSIRVLQLETFDMRLSLEPGSLPNLMCYNGFTGLISAARTSGAIWENLVQAELCDAYRWEKGLLDAMPRLQVLDITVAAGDGDLLARIAEKCGELRSLTLRDSNGIMHDRRDLADSRLSGIALLPDFAASFVLFKHLSSLTIDPVFRSRQHAPLHTDRTQLIAWHAYCPTLRHFTSPTGRQWMLVSTELPSRPSSFSVPLARPLQISDQWTVIFEPVLSENVFATDPGLFGMRRAGSVRGRSEVGNVDELIAIIERLNRERASV